jgi:hypothetical protein
LEFHFFQYCDLDLAGTAMDSSVEISGGNTAAQSDYSYGYYAIESETVDTPRPSHHQAAYYPTILNSLNDDSPTTLTDANGPIGPGDLNWAFQWAFNIAPGSSVIISKDKTIVVPEPATMGLLALGGLALMRRRGRK